VCTCVRGLAAAVLAFGGMNHPERFLFGALPLAFIQYYDGPQKAMIRVIDLLETHCAGTFCRHIAASSLAHPPPPLLSEPTHRMPTAAHDSALLQRHLMIA